MEQREKERIFKCDLLPFSHTKEKEWREEREKINKNQENTPLNPLMEHHVFLT